MVLCSCWRSEEISLCHVHHSSRSHFQHINKSYKKDSWIVSEMYYKYVKLQSKQKFKKNINWRIRLGFNSKWINQIIIDSTPKIEKILMSLSMMKQICSFPQKSIFVYVMWRNLFWRNRSWKCITLKSFASWLVNHHHQGVFCRGRKSLRIYLNAKCEIDAWI